MTVPERQYTQPLAKSQHALVSDRSRLGRVAPHVCMRFVDEKAELGWAVDRAISFSGILIVTGWQIGLTAFESRFDTSFAGHRDVTFFPRPDVADQYRVNRRDTRGFLAIFTDAGDIRTLHLGGTGSDDVTIVIDVAEDSTREDVASVLGEHTERLGFILRMVNGDSNWVREIIGLIPRGPSDFNMACGFIEQAKGLPQVGGVAVGWATGLPSCDVLLVTSSGLVRKLDEAARWHRDDITLAYKAEFGPLSLDAGYLAAFNGVIGPYGSVYLVAIDDHKAYVIAEREWSTAAREPTSFAQWVFSFPLRYDQFAKALEHVAPVIAHLVEAQVNGLRKIEPVITNVGPPCPDPITSIVIPLYGRSDFIPQQLLSFADDAFIRNWCEIVYVIDDPRIRGDIMEKSALYYELYRVPFKIVDGRMNRGYSSANNIGAAHTRAQTTLFLNSDVFPMQSGWLEKLLMALAQDTNVGIVGARLAYHNGSIQHDGMAFEWHPGLSAHLNRHPHAGFEAHPPRSEPQPKIAVTGACMLMSRDTFDDVGGFDQHYLVGDFEDSDLCLKVRATGRTIALVENVSLVHLERQSFTGIGETDFRQKVVYYNLYRHEKIWGEAIHALGRNDVRRGTGQ